MRLNINFDKEKQCYYKIFFGPFLYEILIIFSYCCRIHNCTNMCSITDFQLNFTLIFAIVMEHIL